MSNNKSEVINNLRTDIRSKLKQIGLFVDNELVDYIMVLVANQKNKYQMKDDLSLFLGATTDEFVNWLHSTLKQIQISAQNEDKKSVTNDIKDIKETKDIKKTNLSSKTRHKKHLTKSDKNSDDINEDSKCEKTETNRSIDSSKPLNKNTSETKSDLKSNKSENISEKQNNGNNKKEEINENKEQTDGDVIIHLKPDGGDIDELLQENDINESKDQTEKEVQQKTIIAEKTIITPNSRVSPLASNNKQQKPKEEDNDEPIRSTVGSVASVVRVSQRKSSVPIEMQANKNLLLKAMKDANDSIHPNRKRSADSIEYTPTPIKKRLGEKQDLISKDNVQQELDPKDLRNYLNVNKQDSNKSENFVEKTNQSRKVRTEPIKEIKDIEEMSPQFVVTLDGVDHNKYLKNSEYVSNDSLLFDEEMDEEFVESENVFESENLENNDLSGDKVSERCRFWPACKNGDDCEFIHPSTPCKTFPNCRFGDKCIYIHPNCKFDSMCSRRDCPFTHASRRKIPTSALISSIIPPTPTIKQCKYAPNCKNPVCPYYHPKICRFGGKCRSNNCPFIHPTLSYGAQHSFPFPHQLKWKAKDHISERQYSLSTEKELKSKAQTL